MRGRPIFGGNEESEMAATDYNPDMRSVKGKEPSARFGTT